jgi:ABC-type glycerol-3-phosphate transport system substrate-binding protein
MLHRLRKKLLVPLIIGMMLLLVAGCAIPASAPGGSGVASSSQPVKVVYWAHNFEPRVRLDEKYIAEFMEANPDIIVEYEVIPSDFDAKLRTALAAGTGPDLFAQWNGDIGTFYAEEAISPVIPEALGFGSQQELMDLYLSPENILQGATFEGILYGIPNEVSIYACYVNKTLFEEAGLDPDADFPATWEQMVDVATQLTIRDADGKLVQQGFDFDWGAAAWMFLQYGAMVRQLGGSELDLNTPEAAQAMQYWVDWANNGLGGPAYWTSQTDDFMAGRVAIKCGMGSWAKPLAEEADIDYTVKPVPIFQDAVNRNHFDTYAYFHMVNARSAPEVQEAAWKLAWYLDSHPVDYLENTGLLQPQKVLVDSEEFQSVEFLDVFLAEMEVSMYSPRIPRFLEVADVLMRARDRAVVEGMDVAESLSIAQDEINAILGTSN